MLTLFLDTTGTLSRQSSGMKDILKKGCLQKILSSWKCLHLKKRSLCQSDPYLLLESVHIQWSYLVVELVLLFLFKSLANRSSHSEMLWEMGVLKFETKIHEKYLWRSSFLVKLLELLQSYFSRILIANIIWQN